MHSFSIIIPFKTGNHYLKTCVESVLVQTYQNFTIFVLTDDSSNEDGAIDYLKSIADSRIEIISSKENLDILANWSRIKEVSTSAFMTILGYDDVLYPNFLEEINKLIISNPLASLYHSHFHYIDKNGLILENCKPIPTKLKSVDYLELALKDKISIMATGYVFRTSDYRILGGINTKYPNLIYADLQLWIDLTEIGYLVTSTKYLFSFRIHASTTKVSKDKILMDSLFIFITYLSIIKLKSEKYKTVISMYAGNYLEQTTKSIAHRLLRTPKDNRNGMSIDDLVSGLKIAAKDLGVAYHPEKIISFKIALLIEKNALLSLLFLLFKRIYKQPVY
jgi:glycosyltransferase involved in cell wall biosynthesis